MSASGGSREAGGTTLVRSRFYKSLLPATNGDAVATEPHVDPEASSPLSEENVLGNKFANASPLSQQTLGGK